MDEFHFWCVLPDTVPPNKVYDTFHFTNVITNAVSATRLLINRRHILTLTRVPVTVDV